MTDSKLLELAAKAAGIEICWPEKYVTVRVNNWGDDDKELQPAPHLTKGDFVGKPWNPLTDDGDALRLAVALKLNVGVTDKDEDGYARAIVSCFIRSVQIRETLNDDPCAVTRRAIVRAAAEVSKGLLTQDEFILMFPDRFDDETVEKAAAKIERRMK